MLGGIQQSPGRSHFYLTFSRGITGRRGPWGDRFCRLREAIVEAVKAARKRVAHGIM